ncbi:MAG: hypothetical protein ACI8WT_005004 [Clostridium sp.]|jgi:hypothetical protein
MTSKISYALILSLYLSSCFMQENKLNNEKKETKQVFPSNQEKKELKNFSPCVIPTLLSTISYIDGDLISKDKILIYSGQSDNLSGNDKTIQDNLGYTEYNLLNHLDYRLFPSHSILPTVSMKKLSSIHEQTLLMNKEQSKVYRKCIEVNRYTDKNTDNYRINFYVPKLNDKGFTTLIKTIQETTSLTKKEQRDSFQLCLNSILLGANLRDKLNYLLDSTTPFGTLNKYQCVYSITESATYFQASTSGLTQYLGTLMGVEMEPNQKWGKYQIDVSYTLPQILHLTTSTLQFHEPLIYASSEDLKEIVVTINEGPEPIIDKNIISEHYTISNSQFFYFKKLNK